MSNDQHTDQLELPLDGRGEAPRVERSGEAVPAVQGGERSGIDDLREQLMEQVVERGNLVHALKRVRANRGRPGVDGRTVDDLVVDLKRDWAAIREQLLTGRYQPSAVKRVEIPKPGGGVRQLGIPTVLDHFILQALLQALQPRIDPTFSEHSYGFRPGRRWVVDVDLEKFFDRVNHDVLMGKLARHVADRRVLKLVRRSSGQE